jgi:hypothetical protein
MRLGPVPTLALFVSGVFLLAAVDPARGQVLVSQDLGKEAYTASKTWRHLAPEHAFDGVTQRDWDYWNSGGHPPHWVEVDLQRGYAVSQVKLVVAQWPRGPNETVHEVWVSDKPILDDPSDATLAYTFSRTTREGDYFGHELATPVWGRYVQIRTTRSPSWVAWREVQVFAAVPF